MMCEHKEFRADVIVNRLEDRGLFNADIKVTCAECGTPFRFLGLPIGLDLYGSSMGVDGLEARLAIEPATETNSPLHKMNLDGGGSVKFKI